MTFRTAAALAALACLLAGCDTPKPNGGSEPVPEPVPAGGAPAQVAGALLRQANQARRQLGLAPLRADRVLTGVAETYSRELARRGEVSHESPTPYRRTLRERLRAAGAVNFGVTMENLASSSEAEELLPLQVVVLWMRTPAARAALAAPEMAFAGTGAARADDGTWYLVQIYAAPREVEAIQGLPQP